MIVPSASPSANEPDRACQSCVSDSDLIAGMINQNPQLLGQLLTKLNLQSASTTQHSQVPVRPSVPLTSQSAHSVAPSEPTFQLSTSYVQSNSSDFQRPNTDVSQEVSISMAKRVPRFTEKYDGTTSWAAFLRLFEFNAERLGWNEVESSWALLNSLTGRAAAAVSSLLEDLQTKPQYSFLRRWLQNRFGTKTNPRVARMELFQRQQGLDESLEDFAIAL